MIESSMAAVGDAVASPTPTPLLPLGHGQTQLLIDVVLTLKYRSRRKKSSDGAREGLQGILLHVTGSHVHLSR